ncbi:MAG: hypothetical protein C0467_14755 [Planctomycetaceae bacterium]|nr:hypothetical protein [Planctomycetaceae bacterium]
MATRFAAICAGVFISASVASAEGGGGKLSVVPTKLFAIESVSVSYITDKREKKTQEWKKFDAPIALPTEGPFEVIVKTKDGGVPQRVIEKLTLKTGETHELKIGDLLGSVEVFGDNFPRASKIVLTDVKDDGPGEKGHVARQVAKDYRVEMAVPPGMYAVWVVPDNGAKPQKVVENVRVQAGRSTRVGD